MKALRFLTPLFRAHRLALSLALCLSAVTILSGIALLGISGWFLTAAALTTLAASFNLFGPSSLIRGLSLLRIISRYFEKLAGHDATLRLLTDLRTNTFRKLFSKLPLESDRMSHGDLVSRLTGDIDMLDAIFIVGAGPLITSVFSAAVMAAVVNTILPEAFIPYCLALSCAVIFAPALLFIACRRSGKAMVVASAHARNSILNSIQGHADLVAFGQISIATGAFKNAANRLGIERKHLALYANLAMTVIQFLTGSALLALLLTGLTAFHQNSISAPVFVGLLLATLASFESASSVVRGVGRFGSALAAASRISELIGDSSAVHADNEAKPIPSASNLILDKVTFAHGAANPVLEKLDLHVPSGQRIALIGSSGCGKSTLLSFLVRLREPCSGTIMLGGVDIRELNPDALRKQIVLLTQDAPVFMGTIRENLLIGDPEASNARLMAVLADVRLDGLIRNLPLGLDSFIGETGSTLSVGQVRRICLARALLSKAEILLLDEPTSSLDADMEKNFFADLAAIADRRTIIVATHAPLGTLGTFDKCYRIQDGQLREV